MYNLIKNVIETKDFDLKAIIRKIDALWLKGEISDNNRTELYSLVQNSARPEASVDIIAKLSEMEKRIRKIEGQLADNSDLNSSEENSSYPEYVSGKWYYAGDKMAFEGVSYSCIAPEGTVCVWSPVEYPAYWEVI